ncbi:alpha/beta fold hydrolase [Streptomyces sp. NPDC058000]|uniref:alpha/beta fold hydrolase n=1 Tax=Streptomyces sp. NPDC058000 TaxID=3346299 RepID=UPI0036E6D09D
MAAESIRELTVEGLTCKYRVLAQPDCRTEPILVLGGALQDKYGWQNLDAALQSVASLITVDLPGSGEADPLRPDQGMEVVYAVVERVLDDVGAGRANIFGYSFGSTLAFTFAQHHPGRVARLMLGGVPVEISDHQFELWRQAAEHMAAGDTKGFVDLALRLTLCYDESRTVRHRKLVHRYVKRLMTHAVTRIPHGFSVLNRTTVETVTPSGGLRGVPTLVFCGEHDTLSTPEQQRAFADTIEGSHFVTLTESDHWAALERAEDVTDLMIRFFTDQPLDRDDFARPLEREPQVASTPF